MFKLQRTPDGWPYIKIIKCPSRCCGGDAVYRFTRLVNTKKAQYDCSYCVRTVGVRLK